MQRIPPWIRAPLATDRSYARVSRELKELGLHTVCAGARCPNRHACWNQGTATFMILGDRCTRNCSFCAVDHGKPEAPSADEPRRVAEGVRRFGLKHVVVTSVTRDDLPDGGATQFAATIRAVQRLADEVSTEVLIPDFKGEDAPLDSVLDAGPDVLNHNVETVARLQSVIRPQASYATSLGVLRQTARRSDVFVKSGLMVGLGETDEEVRETLRDLSGAGCRLISIGQYLTPTRRHPPVQRYVHPDMFETYAEWARDLGFVAVASSPLTRSSHHAAALLQQARGAPRSVA